MNEPKLIIIENMTNCPTIPLSTVIKLTIWIRLSNLTKIIMGKNKIEIDRQWTLWKQITHLVQ